MGSHEHTARMGRSVNECNTLVERNKINKKDVYVKPNIEARSPNHCCRESSKVLNINTFIAIVDLSRFNNSCLKSPASTLVNLTFQSRALRSFSLNQLRNLSL